MAAALQKATIQEWKCTQQVGLALNEVLWGASVCDRCKCGIAIAFAITPCNLTVCFKCANSKEGTCNKKGCAISWAAHNRIPLRSMTNLLLLARLQSGKTKFREAVQFALDAPFLSGICATAPKDAEVNTILQMVLTTANSNLSKYRRFDPNCKIISLESAVEGPSAPLLLTAVRSTPTVWAALRDHLRKGGCEIKENLPEY